MSIKEKLPPNVFRDKLQQGQSVDQIVRGICSRSRGYQLLHEYRKKYPAWFPKKRAVTKEELKKMLQTHTITATANHFNVSVNTLKSYMKKWSLEKPTYKEQLPPSLLKKLIKNYSDEEIARRYRCSIHTVRKLRYENAIYRRNKGKEEVR